MLFLWNYKLALFLKPNLPESYLILNVFTGMANKQLVDIVPVQSCDHVSFKTCVYLAPVLIALSISEGTRPLLRDTGKVDDCAHVPSTKVCFPIPINLNHLPPIHYFSNY